MNFGFTEEQDLLRAEARKWLDARCPVAEVRKIADTPDGHSATLWPAVAQMGWPGLAIPEPYGGAGLGLVDLVVLLEETGRTLFPAPLVSTSLVATMLRDFGDDAQRQRWLPGLAAGRDIGAVAWLETSDRFDLEGVALAGAKKGDAFVLRGDKQAVHDAGSATLWLVPFRTAARHDAVSLAVVPRTTEGVAVDLHAGIDATRRTGRVRFDGVHVTANDVLSLHGASALDALLDRGAALTAAEMIGAMDGALAMLVRYAKERVQFGSPIGRFQGVKHPLAEHYVAIESAKSLVYHAAWLLDENAPGASRAASMAKAFATEAFSRLGIDVVQLHGGIGYTWEYDAQLYLKRSKWARPAFGDADLHWDRVSSLDPSASEA